MPAIVPVGREANGMMEKGQIMRWILEGVNTPGVTIRLCTRGGQITFYVSSDVPNPSEEVNDRRATVATTDRLTISCDTYFSESSPIPGRRRKRSENAIKSVYISIIGNEQDSAFSLITVEGNITLGEIYTYSYIG